MAVQREFEGNLLVLTIYHAWEYFGYPNMYAAGYLAATNITQTQLMMVMMVLELLAQG